MKLFFLGHDDTELAEPDPAFIRALQAELLQRAGVSLATDPAQADAILVQEKWAFREWRYIDRLLAEPVIGRYPHKTYTINADDAATGLLRGLYTSLPALRFDSALHAAAPYILAPNEIVLQTPPPPPHPRYLATWRGNVKSNRALRQRLVRLYSQSPAFCIETTDSWLNHDTNEKRHYAELIQSGHFSLCPAGWGSATFRVFESMALGVAPVIIADQNVLPRGPRWEDCSVRVAETDLARLETILDRQSGRYLEMGRAAREAWHQYFSPDRLVPYYADTLLECIQISANRGSREEEIQRWRSRHMYRTNRWTILQRIGNKVRLFLENRV